MVVAASPAMLHQTRFFPGDTAGFSKRALTFRHDPRAEGVDSGLHQGLCCSLNPGRGKKLRGRDPRCRHSLPPGQSPVIQPSRSTESLQTLLLPTSSAAVPSSAVPVHTFRGPAAGTNSHSHSVSVQKNIFFPTFHKPG